MPLVTRSTQPQTSSTQVTAPNLIRAGQSYTFALAKDLEDLSYNVNTLQLQVRSMSDTLSTIQAAIAAGFTGTVTVRNAAGTGTSTLVFTKGALTSYTP